MASTMDMGGRCSFQSHRRLCSVGGRRRTDLDGALFGVQIGAGFEVQNGFIIEAVADISCPNMNSDISGETSAPVASVIQPIPTPRAT